MDQGGVRMIGLRGRGRPHTAPRLGDTPADPFGIAGVKLLGRKNVTPPEKVLVVGRDSVRHLRCSSAVNPPPAVLLSASQLQAIKQAAQQVSEETRLQQVKAAREATKKALEERLERRRLHEKVEAKHRRRQRRDELRSLEAWPPEDDEKAVLEEEHGSVGRRQELEREEEVQELRRLVLAAKCHAIREAQILEKQHIKQLEKEEEERQADMMEEARQQGLKKEEQREKARQEACRLEAEALNRQIHQQDRLRLQQFREKRKEAKNVAREAEKYRAEVELDKKKRKEKILREKEESRKVREEAEVRKEGLLKASKLNDVKMVAQMVAREKAAQVRVEEEAALRKTKNDLQLLWLKDQERKLEEERRRDELRHIREQEKLEREWRKKELLEVQAKAQREATVAQERRQQVEDRQNARMAAALRQKEELLKVTDHWMITEERERLHHHNAKKAKVDYESRIRAQIEDQEARRAKEAEKLRQEKEEEVLKLKMKEAALTRLKRDTMQDLRKMALPEQLVQDLEKKLHLRKDENKIGKKIRKTTM